MKYAVYIGSGVMIYITTGTAIQKLIRDDIYAQGTW